MQITVIAESASGFTRQLALAAEHPDNDRNDDRYPVTITRRDDGSIELKIDLHKHELSRKASVLHIIGRR